MLHEKDIAEQEQRLAMQQAVFEERQAYIDQLQVQLSRRAKALEHRGILHECNTLQQHYFEMQSNSNQKEEALQEQLAQLPAKKASMES